MTLGYAFIYKNIHKIVDNTFDLTGMWSTKKPTFLVIYGN